MESEQTGEAPTTVAEVSPVETSQPEAAPVELTPKQQICRALLLNAPPGEFNEVLDCCRTLVGDDSQLEGVVQNTTREYNTEQMTVATLPDGEKGLITAYGEIDQNQYIIPHKSMIVTFDHLQQSVLDTRTLAQEELSDQEPLRVAVERAVTNYVRERYPDGVCEVYANMFDDGRCALVICIQATKLNPSSMWTGRWRSTWTITLNGAQAEAKGNLQVHTHCYEGGNVQLQAGHEASAMLEVSEPDVFSNVVVEMIRNNEMQFHQEIDDSFVQLSEVTFKALRRALPLTKKKIDWATIAGQARLGHEMGRK